LLHEQDGAPESITVQGATPGVAWNFSKFPLFSPDRTNQLRARSSFSAPHLPGAIQAKLVVGQVNDPLEYEADRVADQAMRVSEPELAIAPAPAQLSQKCAACEEEEPRKLGARPAGVSVAGGSEAPAIVHEVLRSIGQPLDRSTRACMEPRFGRDFADIRVHADPAAGESARAIGALAYASANHIVFAPGQYVPGSDHGRQLLAHELAHTGSRMRAALDPCR